MALQLGMISCILWPFFLQVTLLFSLSFSQLEGNETDRLSLLAFKAQITGDPLGKLSSWNQSFHFCEWSGVTCGSRHQRVVELDLHSWQLVGSLTPHIGNLSFLRTLNLANNSLKHNIPQELGRLFRLQKLILRNNTFGSQIPVNISRCSNLQFLDLSSGDLTGQLPAELGSLSKLQVLVFEHNNFVGEIPLSFGNLTSIETIYGSLNNLQGSIPNVIGQLTRLEVFSLGANNLSGTIPPLIYNLSSLTLLSLPFNNQLHGILPHNLFRTLPNLEVLNIMSNKFSGPIPISLSNASNLLKFAITTNNFTGKFPSLSRLYNLMELNIGENSLGKAEDDDLNFLHTFANETSLEILYASDNNFGGVLPQIISNFSTKLMKLAFARNYLRGSIPTEIGNLISLVALGLETNQLTGTIPNSMGQLQQLGALFLNENKISGSIPSSLGNMTSLIDVNLRLNNLQGNIPSSLGNCKNLLRLVLSENNLSGPLPDELLSISSLSQYLVLSENQLTGSIPTAVGKLVNVGYLDLSKNKLSGEVPKSLGSCVSLESLHLEENLLQGPIPETLSSLRAIQDLNLSYNNLTGRLPKFLGDLKLLESLDLSFNEFEGEVPVQGVFRNKTGISVLGNMKLCGGIPQLNLSRCVSGKTTKSKSSTKLIVIAICCGFLGIISTTAFLYFYCFRKTKDKPAASQSSWKASFPRVSYEDLLQATEGFSISNLIGVGGFGSVYRGTLMPDKTLVAVKVLNLLHKEASKSFIAECEALMNVRHRNLVKVLTVCSSIDFQGNDFKALVYEFMVNGSLEEWLHPAPHPLEDVQAPKELDLIQRLNIAIDVASALDYLHNDCQTPIVHCDLKPSNILLDSDMTGHVGDFGLARYRHPDQASHQSSSDQTSSVGLKGTIGYAAPEYGMGGKVSTHGDVYSYGILLLEMFTRKRPTDGMFKDGLNLHSYAKMALPDRVLEIVDPILLTENATFDVSVDKMDHIGTQKMLECLVSIIKVGVACSVELPRERMDMSNVVTELHRIRGIPLRITGMHRQREIVFLP